METKITAGLAFLTLAATIPALAHHSFAADYDASKPITVHGTVTKVEWMNPHVRFFLAEKDNSGKMTDWEFELGSPNTLMRSGWTRESLKTGAEITVKRVRSKDSSNLGNATSILSSDGKVLLAGVSAGETLVAR
jgi:Family of unknown function (DUF6152)